MKGCSLQNIGGGLKSGGLTDGIYNKKFNVAHNHVSCLMR